MKTLISCLVAVIIIGAAHAQQAGDRISKTSVIIFNSADKKLSILLGEKNKKADSFQLNANETWYSPAYTKDPIVKIKTKNHITTYQLKLGTHYMIFWNDKKKYWDIRKV